MADEINKIIFEVEVVDQDGVKSLDSMAAATRKLNQERRALDLTTEAGQKRFNELTASINKNNEAQKALGTNLEKQRLNVGNYSKSIQDAAGNLNIFGSGVSNATQGFSGFTAAAKAFIATPLGAVIGVLGAAFTVVASAVQKSEVALDKIEDITSAVSNAFGVLTSRIAQLLDGTRSLTNLFTDFNEEVSQAVTQGQLYIDILRDLEDAQFKYRVENAAAENQIKSLVVAAKNKNLTFQEQEALLNKALELERNLVEQRTELAQKEAVATIKQIALERGLRQTSEETFKQFTDRLISTGVLGGELTDKVVSQIEKVEQARSSSLAFEEKVQNQLDAINQKKTAAAEKEAENLRKLDEQIQKSRGGEVEAVETTELKKLEVRTDFAKLNIEIAKKQTEEEKKLAQDQALFEQELGRQRITTAQIVANGLGQALSAFGIKSKGISSALALANTFLGVTEILKSPTAPFIEPFASIVRGTQIATTIATGLGAVRQINSAKFARGGIADSGGVLSGPSHAQGGINFSVGGKLGFEAEGGEAIINKRSTAMFKPILSAINAAGGGVKFANGGITGGFETQTASAQSTSMRFMSELKAAVMASKPVLILEEFEAKTETKTEIQNTARVI